MTVLDLKSNVSNNFYFDVKINETFKWNELNENFMPLTVA